MQGPHLFFFRHVHFRFDSKIEYTVLDASTSRCRYEDGAIGTIAVETNGSIALPDAIDWITVSPKVAEHALRQLRANELRYVRAHGQGIPRPSCQAEHKLISPAFEADGLGGKNLSWCIELVKPISTNAQVSQDQVVRAVQTILLALGEAPDREGLRETPARVHRALLEMTQGYLQSPSQILGTTFDEPCDEVVILKSIPFTSLCEHHMLPFFGTATVGYLPSTRVVGLSKLARLVDCFAARLQIQERMTNQIAGAIMEHLNPLGAGVVVAATHGCMACRGVKKPGAVMITSALLGNFRSNSDLRAEFLSIARG